MRLALYFFLFFSPIFCSSEISCYLKQIPDKHKQPPQIQHIDYIYLINLDQRPEKKEKSLAELAKYQLLAYRFPAIYGWDLSADVLYNIGVPFTKNMEGSKWALDGGNDLSLEFLSSRSLGKTLFSSSMTLGAIGCSLSHLSLLQDAYRSGFETIWI